MNAVLGTLGTFHRFAVEAFLWGTLGCLSPGALDCLM